MNLLGRLCRIGQYGEAGYGVTASRHFAELWTTFARTGKPAAKDVPQWPAYNLKTRPTMRIDTTCQVIDNRFSRELAMWRSIGRM
nr:carboxylesterase family protein [Spirosoma panaciterrae]